MFSRDDDGHLGLVLGLCFGLLGLLIALVIAFLLPSGWLRASSATPRQAVTPVVAAPALDPQLSADAAGVEVESGIVRIYFAPGSKVLARGLGDALSGIVRQASSGGRLAVSGFHDNSGDAARNSLLARQRALAVRDQLASMGVPLGRIELKKSTGLPGGSDAQARRVEVSLSRR